jgi:hypothetical protein
MVQDLHRGHANLWIKVFHRAAGEISQRVAIGLPPPFEPSTERTAAKLGQGCIAIDP